MVTVTRKNYRKLSNTIYLPQILHHLSVKGSPIFVMYGMYLSEVNSLPLGFELWYAMVEK